MRTGRAILTLPVVLAILSGAALAAPFVLFPKAGELLSPDGKFAVRNAERNGFTTDFLGTSQALWLIELSSGRSRKLCNYLGVAAVAWSSGDFVVVTEYVGKKTSRAWIFPVNRQDDAILLDQPSLTHLVPVEFREALRQNHHVFVEATKVEQGTVHFRIWGYGQHDPSGFRLHCEYGLREPKITCSQDHLSR